MWKALQEGIGDMATTAKSALEEGSRILNDMDNSLGLIGNEDAEKSGEIMSGEEMDFSEGEPRDESTTRNVKEKEMEELSHRSVVNEMSGSHVSSRSSTLEATTYYDAKNQSELMGDVSGTFRNPLFPDTVAAGLETKQKLDDSESLSAAPWTPIAVGGDDSMLSAGSDETGNFISLLKERQEEIEKLRKKLAETEEANAQLTAERVEQKALEEAITSSQEQHLENVKDSQMCEENTDIVAALQRNVELLQGQIAEYQQVNAVSEEGQRRAERNVESLEMQLKQTTETASMKAKEMELRLEVSYDDLGKLMERLDELKDELLQQQEKNAQKQGEIDDLVAHNGVLKDQIAGLNILLQNEGAENDIPVADMGTTGKVVPPALNEPSEYIGSSTRSGEDVFSAVPLHLELAGAEAMKLQAELDAAKLRATDLEDVTNVSQKDLKVAKEEVLQLKQELVDVTAEVSRLGKASSDAAELPSNPCVVDELLQNAQELENRLQKAGVAQAAAFKERDEALQQLSEMEKMLDEVAKDRTVSERESRLAIDNTEQELVTLRERQLEIESSTRTQVQELQATAEKRLEDLENEKSCTAKLTLEVEELRNQLEESASVEKHQSAELQAQAAEHLEDLENEKSCTAKLILEVEELRNQLEDAVDSKKKLCHELEVHDNERQAEEELITSMKKHVIGLAVNERVLIMDLDREFQQREQLYSEFESEAKSYIKSLQTKLDQCLIDLNVEKDATARVILERNELKDSFEILLKKQKIKVDKAEVKNIELCGRLSELEKEVEFQKQRMQADGNERLAVAQKEFDTILSEQSDRNAIEKQNVVSKLQQLVNEANTQIYELKADATASTLDASQLKEEIKILKEQLQLVQNDQNHSQQGCHKMDEKVVVDEKKDLEYLFEQAQMQAETSAKYVYNITEDKIALQAEVERLTELLEVTKKTHQEETKRDTEEKTELQHQLEAEVNAKIAAETQVITANATAADAALLGGKQNMDVESQTPVPLAAGYSLLSKTNLASSSAFSQRKNPPNYMEIEDLEEQGCQLLGATQDEANEEGRRLQFVGPAWTWLVAMSPRLSGIIKSIPPSNVQYAFIVELAVVHALALWGVFLRHCSSSNSVIGDDGGGTN